MVNFLIPIIISKPPNPSTVCVLLPLLILLVNVTLFNWSFSFKNKGHNPNQDPGIQDDMLVS